MEAEHRGASSLPLVIGLVRLFYWENKCILNATNRPWTASAIMTYVHFLNQDWEALVDIKHTDL